MSCNPGTPCYTSTIYPSGGTSSAGCNLDPCLTIKLGTASVFYNGSVLPCSGIQTCDSLSVALQKIDNILCNYPTATITADNGLTKTGNNIQLGGELIQETSITTSFAYTLSLLGLVNNINPDYFITQDSSGVVTTSSYSTIVSSVSTSVIANVTANNGLTKTGSTIKLGGTLLQNTTIDTNNYSLGISDSDGTIYSYANLSKSANVFESGDDIVANPTGSFVRAVTFKSSGATSLTNYASSAYDAQATWEAAHPWVVMDALHNFQIFDNIYAVNRASAFIYHYYDERVNNANWDETWYSLVDYTADTGLPALNAGDYFTIANYVPGDDFSMSATSIYSGTMNTTGCVFLSNGVAPTWTASRIDGDFPTISLDVTASAVITDDDSGTGRIRLIGEDTYLKSTTTHVEGKLDQSTATRGFVPAQWTNLTQPGSPDLGEMGFNTTLGQMEYWDGASWIQF